MLGIGAPKLYSHFQKMLLPKNEKRLSKLKVPFDTASAYVSMLSQCNRGICQSVQELLH